MLGDVAFGDRDESSRAALPTPAGRRTRYPAAPGPSAIGETVADREDASPPVVQEVEPHVARRAPTRVAPSAARSARVSTVRRVQGARQAADDGVAQKPISSRNPDGASTIRGCEAPLRELVGERGAADAVPSPESSRRDSWMMSRARRLTRAMSSRLRGSGAGLDDEAAREQIGRVDQALEQHRPGLRVARRAPAGPERAP